MGKKKRKKGKIKEKRRRTSQFCFPLPPPLARHTPRIVDILEMTLFVSLVLSYKHRRSRSSKSDLAKLTRLQKSQLSVPCLHLLRPEQNIDVLNYRLGGLPLNGFSSTFEICERSKFANCSFSSLPLSSPPLTVGDLSQRFEGSYE